MDFLGNLFDFSFSKFITTKLVKVLYAILLIIIVLGFLGGIGSALLAVVNGEIASGLGLLCATPIAAILYVLLARVWTELIIVVFRIAENTTELVEQGKSKYE